MKVEDILGKKWYQIYSWPEVDMPENVPVMSFNKPSELENVLFHCRCTKAFPPAIQLLQVVLNDNKSVMAVEFIEFYNEIEKAVQTPPCVCKTNPTVSKTVLLPLSNGYILQFVQTEEDAAEEDDDIYAYLLAQAIPNGKDLLQLIDNIQEMSGKPGGLLCMPRP
ncbi:hypothetical protein EVAR_91858_1 [Eumeta japonica]|uniref:Uncharacterized protein n=1 Tax=Eumeta variegata TaxID=151549 RepID=A0A4C2A8V5_EUMVA|nr:hypothetical protein EVAR_91858_1 [Eumeta japonica]